MTKQEFNRLDRIVRGLEEFKDRPESVNLRIVELRVFLDEMYRELLVHNRLAKAVKAAHEVGNSYTGGTPIEG